jgi:hypothetical protein
MTADEVRAEYGQLQWPGATDVPVWRVFSREQVGVLLAEIDRLKAGRFTEEEFQNLCHQFTPDDRERFEAGCRAYQAKLFGVCPAAPKEGRDHAD